MYREVLGCKYISPSSSRTTTLIIASSYILYGYGSVLFEHASVVADGVQNGLTNEDIYDRVKTPGAEGLLKLLGLIH